jgi:gluconate 2-dehydrogenase gamma chain
MTPADEDDQPSRRNMLQNLSLLPLAVATAIPATVSRAGADTPESAYKPAFFNPDEWAFIQAACDRLIPHDEVGPGAVELGVPEFIDRHAQTLYAAGAIFYMAGPFIEASPEFGYQGSLAPRDILRVGFKAIDGYCKQQFNGKRFAELPPADQETILHALEGGKIEIEEISAKLFFTQFLGEVRNGYFADPKHGGNKGMGSWKMIGYPGMRASYLDWVEVRDRAYPLPPVDLAGKRA